MAGFYGKLPARGDFVDRDLTPSIKTQLDEWFQQGMHQAYKSLGEQTWLEIYRHGPIWHFYMSPGVLDDKAWLGVWLPSVDKDNRKFPLIILAPTNKEIAQVEALQKYKHWLKGCEERLVDAVLEQIDFEQFCRSVAILDPNHFDVEVEEVNALFGELGIGGAVTEQAIQAEDSEKAKTPWQQDIEAKLTEIITAVQKIAQHTGIELQLDHAIGQIQQQVREQTEAETLAPAPEQYSYEHFDYNINLINASSQAKANEFMSQAAPYVIWSSKGSAGIGVTEQLVVTAKLPCTSLFEKFLTGFD